MRLQRAFAVAAVLVVGQVQAQEPARTASNAAAADPPVTSATASSDLLLPRPSIRSRLTSWRPISRFFGWTSPSEDEEPVPIRVAQNPAQPAQGIAGSRPPVPPVDPFEGVADALPPALGDAGTTPRAPGDAGTTPPAFTDRAAQTAAGAEAESAGSLPISSNPAAVNIIAGTGALGRALGFDKDSGIRIGGLWVGDATGILTGGAAPGVWALNSLTIADLNLDAEKLIGWDGASFGIQYLNFTGQNTNGLAGAFPGFNSIEAGVPPFERNQLNQLWYRQSLFDDKLIIRIGQMVPTYDFNNVIKPVPGTEPAAAIPAVTALAYTPVFVNPTMLGVIPGYFNSAAGITTTFAPTKSVYLNYGFYDGNLARGVQTGLEGPHFNSYYFHIGEVGFSYRLGRQRKPGSFGVGVWGQTGELQDLTGVKTPNGFSKFTHGAVGTYLFGSQRLWFRNPGVDSSGVSGFYQFGANNSNALHAREYVGGGLTAFGLVPGRPADTFGAGLNCTWLTQGASSAALFYPKQDPFDVPSLRPSQLMFQCYYQMKLVDGVFFQTTLTDIPTPGIPSLRVQDHNSFPNALAISFQITVLF